MNIKNTLTNSANIVAKVLFIFSMFISSISKGQVVIIGKLVGINFPGKILYNEPIDRRATMYLNEKTIRCKRDGSFEIKSKIQNEGFINIKLPGKTLWLFVEPGDSISFDAMFAIDKKLGRYVFKDIFFRGKNSAGHRAYSTDSAYFDPIRYLTINLFQNRYAGHHDFINGVQTLLQHILSPIDSLYFRSKIDKAYYLAVSADTKSVYCFQIINLYGAILRMSSSQSSSNSIFDFLKPSLGLNRNLFTVENYDSTRLALYRVIHPFDKNILHSFLGVYFTDQYCKDMLAGLIKDTIRYDSSFLLSKTIEHYGYMERSFLEVIWPSYLYWLAATEPDGEKMQKNLDRYIAAFPTSHFLPFLERRYRKAIHDRSLNSHINNDVHFVVSKEYKSLQDVIKHNFEGSVVYVDLWATWCSPCIQEFLYKNQVSKFLDQKQIKMLYVSLDKPTEKERWKLFVRSKQLYGFNYLADPKVVDDLQQVFYGNREITIPRYLLFDQHGNIINSDLPRPSDIEALKREITKLLGK